MQAGPCRCSVCSFRGISRVAAGTVRIPSACTAAQLPPHAVALPDLATCHLASQINDLAVTAELLLRQGRASRVLILDLDVHQAGGGCAVPGAA